METPYPPAQLYILLAITATLLSIASGMLVGSSSRGMLRHGGKIAVMALTALMFVHGHVLLSVLFRALSAIPEDLLLAFNLSVHLVALGLLGLLGRQFLFVMTDPNVAQPEQTRNHPF